MDNKSDTILVQDVEAVNGFDATLKKSNSKKAMKEATPQQDLREVISHLQGYTRHLQEEDEKKKLVEEWRCLSRVIDRMFFWIAIVAVVIASMIIFINTNQQSHLTDLSGMNLTDHIGHGAADHNASVSQATGH